MKQNHDVIIIGSGIAGMTAAIYLKRGGLNPLVIEESAPGGQLNRISTIENYPGFVKITGPDLTNEIYEQVENLEIEYLFDKVIKTELQGKTKKIITVNHELTCNYLIIATGRLSKKLFSEDERYLGKGISYCATCDGPLYKDKDVAVVGGGNSALEEALYLSDICKSVTIIHRRDVFRGDKILIDKVLNKDNIKVLYNSEVVKFNKENDILQSIDINENGKIINLSVKACFIFIGYVPATSFLDNLDILDEKGYIKTDKNLRTDIPFIYACGDTINKNVYQIVTATGEGATAAISFINDYSE